MSSGYGANFAEVIEDKDLNKITGNLITKLKRALGKDYDLNSLAAEFFYDGDDLNEKVFKKAEAVYHEIQKVFKKKTGLEIELAYHDCDDNGDCYDEVNGYFWWVDGMYQLTPAGKKINKGKSVVVRKFYVVYG